MTSIKCNHLEISLDTSIIIDINVTVPAKKVIVIATY